MSRNTTNPSNPPPNAPVRMSRRQFVRQAASRTVGTSFVTVWGLGASSPRWRAAIIGNTGRGDYGHALDQIFRGRDNVDIVAVADASATGRSQATQRTGAARAYADYREMLEREKPQLVSIAPRWTDEHANMARAALECGAHLFVEKPFTQTLAEADAVLALAQRRRLKIAVAHQMRSAPNLVHLKRKLDEGWLGDLLEIRAHGKQDHRAGGEDLLVLGVHLFDLMRLFAGDPQWCAARILQGDREIGPADVRAATEGIGPVVGDHLFAQFAFPRGVNATFQSRAAGREIAGPWGMELFCTKGAVRINANIWPEVLVRPAGKPGMSAPAQDWSPLDGDPVRSLPSAEKTITRANARLVDDWLTAITEDRDPVCSGFNGMKAVEMAMAVFEAGLQKTRVALPMAKRSHPLSQAKA